MKKAIGLATILALTLGWAVIEVEAVEAAATTSNTAAPQKVPAVESAGSKAFKARVAETMEKTRIAESKRTASKTKAMRKRLKEQMKAAALAKNPPAVKVFVSDELSPSEKAATQSR